MSDISKIKDTIRKLMAYANDGQASDGEIENALGHAARLIDKHHLDKSQFTQAEKQAEEKMGSAVGKTKSSKTHQWEATLAMAIEKLFGCVKHYLSNEPVPLRVNGVVQFYTGKYAGQMKMARQFVFYGPAVEAQEAAELYEEWNHMIATMGVIRWGGAYRGDGEAYCQGFADAIWKKACQLNNSRRPPRPARGGDRHYPGRPLRHASGAGRCVARGRGGSYPQQGEQPGREQEGGWPRLPRGARSWIQGGVWTWAKAEAVTGRMSKNNCLAVHGVCRILPPVRWSTDRFLFGGKTRWTRRFKSNP